MCHYILVSYIPHIIYICVCITCHSSSVHRLCLLLSSSCLPALYYMSAIHSITYNNVIFHACMFNMAAFCDICDVNMTCYARSPICSRYPNTITRRNAELNTEQPSRLINVYNIVARMTYRLTDGRYRDLSSWPPSSP